MQIEILEGQTGEIIFKPTFENIPIPDKVQLDSNKSSITGTMKLLSEKSVGDGTKVLNFQALKKGTRSCDLVFVNNDSTGGVEGLDQITKTVGLTISAAGLKVGNISPLQLDWVEGNLYTVNLNCTNGDQVIPINSPDLLIDDLSGYMSIVSRTESSIDIKFINNDQPGDSKVVVAVQLHIRYFSGSTIKSFNIIIPPASV